MKKRSFRRSAVSCVISSGNVYLTPTCDAAWILASSGALCGESETFEQLRQAFAPIGTHPMSRDHDRRPQHTCLDVGAWLKVNTRALGRGALHKKGDSIPLLLTSERHAGRACRRPFTRSVLAIQYPNHIYTTPLLPNDSPVSRTEYVPQTAPPTRYEILSQKLFMIAR